MKLYRVVSYVLDLNGDCAEKTDVIGALEHNRHPEFLSVEEIEETDCGEWDDHHELNQANPPYTKYFPDTDPGPLDSYLKNEYKRVRAIMVGEIEKNTKLEIENRHLKEEISKLQEVKKFVSTIKDLVK